MMNLVINARDSMPDGGLLSIRTANLTLDEPEDYGQFSIGPGAQVSLEVSDTGCGMDRTTRRQIFEPFFTTKEKGKGTGLGLSTVYGIVKQSGGFILVESAPRKGTTFKILFPKSLKKGKLVEAATDDGDAMLGSETILLVEDEDAVRQLLVETLEDSGYRILAARNAEEALALARELDTPMDLVITEVVMPGLSGPELAERLQARYPNTGIIFMTGYTDEVIVDHGILSEGVNLLNKPITVQELLQGIRRVLEGHTVS